MKIIILGGNQVGGTLAENLVNEQHDVTVIDTDNEKLQRLQLRLDLNTLCGSASYPSVLKRAGADDADMLIAVTNNDEVNLVACQVAHSLFNMPTKIARIRSPEYFKFPQLFGKDALPVDVFISPEQLVTTYIERLIEHPGALQVLDFADGRLKLVAIKPFFGGPLVGKTIDALRQDLNIEFRIVAIYRRNHAILPTGDTVIEIGDEVFFLAEETKIRKVMGALRRLDQPHKRVILAGAGNIGVTLVKALELRYDVKVIEHNPERAERLAAELSRATVLCGDVSDRDLLLNENIESTDVFCAVTDDDEANIMACMLAKNLGVRTVMALIKRTVYVDLIESSSIDIAISPQQATISSILRYVRRGDILNVHSLRRGAAEAIEIVAHGDEGTSRVIGRSIRDIKLPHGAMIGAIVRDDKVLMGKKQLVIEPEDRVILFLVNRKKVRDVEKLFQVSIGFFG
jgi:trk system potassium uptake protein